MYSIVLSIRGALPRQVRQASRWAKVEMGPADPILGLTVAFKNDTSPNKVNLGVGAYRDDNGKPYVLPCVREAEKRLLDADHEYAPIGGLPGFTKAAATLTFGSDSAPLNEGRVATVQTLSGTGALRTGFDFIRRFLGAMPVYMPQPTWPNHKNIARDAQLGGVKEYRYFDKTTKGLDFEGFKADLSAAPSGSMVLLHACAHNPTGVDPTPEQWVELSTLCKSKQHLIFFDSAYQGFASGDPTRDAFPVRQFVRDGHDVVVAQSFAKNFGLYGERIGAFHIVTGSAKESEILLSQLRILIRPMYSNPPQTGARIVETILTDAGLTQQWHKDVKLMADRIIGMRQALVDGLKKAGSKKDWSHITKQIGMFCYTGLSGDQVKMMTEKHHVYMTADGRISVAGLTSKNVQYVANALHDVTKA